MNTSVSHVLPETKKITVEIKDLLEEFEVGYQPIITCPEFDVGRSWFRIDVYLNPKENPSHIGVSLWNLNDEDQITSGKIKHTSGQSRSWEKGNTTSDWGFPNFKNFMKLEDYKNWANKNGDIFKLEVSLTLHSKDAPASSDPTCLNPEYVRNSVNLPIMKDEGTADFSIHCDTKTFRVHKNFLCQRSDINTIL